MIRLSAASGVLVVSPESDIRRSLAALVAECGLEPAAVSTVIEAESALEALRNRQFALIICSEELPDGSFDDVLHISREVIGKVPIIVFSRLADWNRYLKVVSAGAFDYVLYPSGHGEMERVVRDALGYAPHRRSMDASAA